MNHLLSSPEEEYVKHIGRVREQFQIIYPIFQPVLIRILPFGDVKNALYEMVIFHDLGKLTKRWQEIVNKEHKEGKNLHKPAHAPVGAAYLYKTLPTNLREPISFATAIHHSDRGLLGDNIERPDVQAINDGIIEYTNNRIKWDERVKELEDEYLPEKARAIEIADLKNMARGLRLWSRGCGLLEEHARRLKMSLIHHILKLCDVAAASERKEYQKEPDNPFGGWLMANKIKCYVEKINARKRTLTLQSELRRCIDVLKEKYKPEKIILFGSLVSGKVGEWSDIDLIIVKDMKKPFLDRSKEILLSLQPKVGMDILVYTPEEFEKLSKRKFFKKEVLSKGVFYE